MIARCKPLLGTFVEIKIDDENSSAFCAADEAFAEIQEIHNLMSFFDEKSEVSRLNSEAHLQPVKVSPEVFEVLNFAKELFAASAGIFDITLHRNAKDQQISFADIELLENSSIHFRKKLQIDLGGIAKGFAVDKASQILEAHGIANYIINAGGDLRVGKKMQKISIRNPKNPAMIICEAEVCEGSLATSSGYFSYQKIDCGGEEKKIYPIFTPNRQALEFKDESVSVFAKSCMIADSLSKIVMILKKDSARILNQFDAQAMMILEDKISYLNQ